MSDLVEAFLAYAANDRDRSAHTLARYRVVLAQIAGEIESDPAYATVEQAEQWWASRYDFAASTRNNDLACARAFYKWLMRFDHRPDDPTRRIDPPKIPRTVPHPMGERDLVTLLDAAITERPDVYRAIALGAYGGLRIDEAAQLEWSAIDYRERRRIYITGKGRKERIMALSPVLLDKILPDTGGNVVTGGGPAPSTEVLKRKVNRFIQRTLYTGPDGDRPMPEKPLTFHALRKRAATLAIAKTGNVYAVAEAFGWESIETAAVYAGAQEETLDAIAAALV